MEELKKELFDLVNKLANAKNNDECGVLLKAIDQKVWLIYTERAKKFAK